MQTILNVVVPIFALIAAGYLSSRTGLLAASVGDGLTKFVFVIAVPALLFRTMATASFADANPLYLWFAYFVAVAVTWGTASILVKWFFATDRRTSVVAGISASFANTVFVAIPAVDRAYGAEALEALFLIISVHLPTMMIAATLLMERAATQDAPGDDGVPKPSSVARTLAAIGRNLSRNGIVVGILCGLALRLTGLGLPSDLDEAARLLGSTAGPVSLFAMGMSLTRYGLRGDLRAATLVSLLSLLLMPGIVYVLGVGLLPPVWLKAAVITAACPAGINAFLLATHFQSGERLAATVILVSTFLAVASLSFWLALLG
ncbi:transporter [Aureimonas sp. Leaf454]|uniref:AEC family transporter n=1 Tax=Aureimonas sp. Leaf454 TaxID=1736381 RepID=UPI0007022A4B|nr:AEC family transporter [Aureimonas sp. Leaf454]KQT44635.1 transporter [Aureimonas sp. Leaf454]